MSKKTEIYVITHSPDDIVNIKEDEIYKPLFVGRNVQDNMGYLSDDSGDNISSKNPAYCELTGLYWMWKNSDADIIGLVHYRRYFAKRKYGKILDKNDLEEIFKDYDIILPNRTTSLFVNVYEDFAHWNYAQDLDLCREIIEETTPEYLNSFDKVMKSNSLYYYNMFIAPKEVIAGYCQWIFPLLFELEKRVDLKGYDSYQQRIFGFLTERLYDVWMDMQDLKVKECELKVIGRRLNIHMWIAKRWIIRKFYVNIYVNLLHKTKKR